MYILRSMYYMCSTYFGSTYILLISYIYYLLQVHTSKSTSIFYFHIYLNLANSVTSYEVVVWSKCISMVIAKTVSSSRNVAFNKQAARWLVRQSEILITKAATGLYVTRQ